MLKQKSIFIIILIIVIAGLSYLISYYINTLKFSSTAARTTHSISLIESIRDKDELRVGMLESHTPYYIDNNPDLRSPSGFDYELIRLFADYLGVEITVIHEKNITSLLEGLEENKFDIIASGLINLPERKKLYRAGPTYYKTSLQLIYQKGKSRPRSLEHLSGQLVVSNNSAQSLVLKNMLNDNPNLKWSESNEYSQEELIRQVAAGNIDYTIGDSVTVSILQRIYPQLATAFDIIEDLPVNWFVQRTVDQSLYDEIIEFFSTISNNGSLARLEDKYLNYIGEFDFVDTRSFINAINNKLPHYQAYFEKYARENNLDWQLLASISYQESHWNPYATSQTGVRGLMMLTLATAKSLGVENRLDPEQSIRGGAEYIKQILARLPTSINEEDRIWFSLAAYNMGYGHLLDARKLTERQGDNPDLWTDVKKRLPMLSQKKYYTQTQYGYARGYQAYNFVENIRRYRMSLAGYLYESELFSEKENVDITATPSFIKIKPSKSFDGTDGSEISSNQQADTISEISANGGRLLNDSSNFALTEPSAEQSIPN